MNEFVQVAQRVVKAVSGVLSFPISVSDEKGYIIGSTDQNRIGTIHKPSKEVLAKDDFVSFDEEKVIHLENVLAGVAVPLKFGHKTIGVLGIIGAPQEVKPHAQFIKRYVEMIWQDTFQAQLKDLERETLEAFLQYILLHDFTNKTRIKQYCEMLHLDYDSKYVCIVVELADSLMNRYEWKPLSTHHSKEMLLNCVQQAFQHGEKDICAFLHVEQIVVLKVVESEDMYIEMMQQFTQESKRLIQLLQAYDVFDVTIAAGSLSHSLEAAHESYYEAEQLIKGGKQQLRERQIYSYHHWDVLLELFPKNIHESFTQKVNERLHIFLEDESFEELRYDFITYCEQNMIITKAAEKLFIHRNTLIYRLNKIEKLTSLDIRSFQHCTLLYTMLKSREGKSGR